MKRVSLKDLADAAGLSKTTVSFILNGKGEEKCISREAIDRVMELADELDYHPNFLAKSLSSGKSSMIGLIVPFITDTFFAQVASIVEKLAAKHGYTVVYGSSEENPEKEQKLIDTFVGKQVDGLIIASSLKNDTGIRKLVHENYPFVLIDRKYDSLDINYVTVNNEDGSYNLVRELLSKGYKHVGMVSVSADLDLMKARKRGYLKALHEGGTAFDESLYAVVDQEDMESSMRKIIDGFLNGDQKVDAIYFTTHYLASVGFKILKEMSVEIPAEVAVCCFGDSPYLEIFEPSITAVPMPAYEIGAEAMRVLLGQMQGGNGSVEKVVLPVRTISRRSW